MAKIMVFIDGTWLYSSVRMLGEDFQIDYGKLPRVLGQKIGARLGDTTVDIVRTFLFGSNATNFAEADTEMVKRRRVFYDTLREEYSYDVETYLIDFRGKRLRKKDRAPDDEFSPEEKCVDIALASSMLYFAALAYVYDIAILVGGDRDFVPALQKVRQLGKRVAIASIRGACSAELYEGKNLKGVRDFDVIWLNDILGEIALVHEKQAVECQSPLHSGKNPVMTDEFLRKNRPFICKACRKKMWREKAALLEEPVQENGDPEEEAEEEELPHEPPPSTQPPPETPLRAGDHYTGIFKQKMKSCGFIETPEGDFYFGMDDCASGTDFLNLEKGAKVEFIIAKVPNRQFKGGKGNGNAEEVSAVEEG